MSRVSVLIRDVKVKGFGECEEKRDSEYSRCRSGDKYVRVENVAVKLGHTRSERP